MVKGDSTYSDDQYMVKFRREAVNGGIKLTDNGQQHTAAFVNQCSIPIYFKCITTTTFVPSSVREMVCLHPGCALSVPRTEHNSFIIAPLVGYPYRGATLHHAMHFGTIRIPPDEVAFSYAILLRPI